MPCSESIRVPDNGRARGLPASAWMLLWSTGALSLALLVYLVDRQAQGAMLVPGSAALAIPPLFGAASAWLPSLIHPFAFSLLSAAALPARRTPAYGAPAAWWAINLSFELGQLPQLSAPIARWLDAGFGALPATQALQRFFLNGQFDPADVLALTAGALLAAGLLRWLHQREQRHEA